MSSLSFSINGIKYPTAFFITRADLMTCKHIQFQKDIDKMQHVNWTIKWRTTVTQGSEKETLDHIGVHDYTTNTKKVNISLTGCKVL